MLCVAPQTRAVSTSLSALGQGISRQPTALMARNSGHIISHCQTPFKVTLGDVVLSVWSSHVTEKRRRTQGTKLWSIAAAESDETRIEFEVDRDKAREALKNLDQQFESISKKKVSPPKIKAVNLSSNTLRDQIRVREEKPEITGSFLVYTAFALLGFTLFYNILFLTVIKPAIDISDNIGTAASDQRGGGGADAGEALLPQQLLSSQQTTLPESVVYKL